MLNAELLSAGGPIVYPLAVCSLVALTLIIERLIALRTVNIAPSEQCKMVRHFIAQKDITGMERWLNSKETPLHEMLLVLIEHWRLSKSRTETSARLEEWASQKTSDMERGLEALGVISSVAPMLGLMGTVLGMVVTFESIQTYGLGNADALAGGISQALLTTLIGLTVGVPTLMAHRFLLTVVDGRLLLLQQLATELLDLLSLLEHGES